MLLRPVYPWYQLQKQSGCGNKNNQTHWLQQERFVPNNISDWEFLDFVSLCTGNSFPGVKADET